MVRDFVPKSSEFTLVLAMLVVLGILVLCILLAPEAPRNPPVLPPNATAEQIDRYQDQLLSFQKLIYEYRKDLLSLILTAFGAWVGAGAAYFFGRENANALLKMKEGSPRERLNSAKVSEMPLRPLDIVVKETDPLQPVVERLKSDNKLWFVTVIDNQGKLLDVIHKEGIWRYVVDHAADVPTATVGTVRSFLAADESLKKNFLGIYVPVKTEMTTGEAHDLLSQRDVFIAVVVNGDGRPMQFFDTGDVRKFLLK